jgi:hypothetical protein
MQPHRQVGDTMSGARLEVSFDALITIQKDAYSARINLI